MKHVTELGIQAQVTNDAAMQAQVMNDVVTQGFALVIDGVVLDELPASIESHVVVIVRRSRAHTLTLKVTPKYVSIESILFETLRLPNGCLQRTRRYTPDPRSQRRWRVPKNRTSRPE